MKRYINGRKLRMIDIYRINGDFYCNNFETGSLVLRVLMLLDQRVDAGRSSGVVEKV